jgi:hypothetical protein
MSTKKTAAFTNRNTVKDLLNDMVISTGTSINIQLKSKKSEVSLMSRTVGHGYDIYMAVIINRFLDTLASECPIPL